MQTFKISMMWVLILVSIGILQNNLWAQNTIPAPIPKEVVNSQMGTTWKKLVLANPDFTGLDYSVDKPVLRADSEKPQATLVQKLSDGSTPLVYTFNDQGVLVALTFCPCIDQNSEAVLSELFQVFGNSPEITEKQSASTNIEYKIYGWKCPDRLVQLYVPSKGKITFRILSLEFAKKAGLL